MSKARELSQRAGVDGALSNRNKVINGSFLVWQRSDNAYGIASYVSADRFQATRGRIRKPNTNGHSGEDNTGAVFDCTDGDIYVHFDHYIEDIGQKLNGKTMTLSFKAKSLNGSPQDMYLEQSGVDYFDFGTTTITVPTEWTTFTFTGTVVSTGWVGGVHLMRWYLNPTGNALSKMIQIDEIQFEEGDKATPFEHRDYLDELARCQWFYRRQTFQDATWQNMFIARSAGNDRGVVFLNHDKEFRVSPTFGHSGAGTFRINNDTHDAPVGTIQAFTRRHQTVLTFISTTTGYGSNAAIYINRQNVSVPCYIEWDAELYG